MAHDTGIAPVSPDRQSGRDTSRVIMRDLLLRDALASEDVALDADDYEQKEDELERNAHECLFCWLDRRGSSPYLPGSQPRALH